MQEVEIIISGKVQAVGFRVYAQEHANDLNIVGYIQNLEDGNVEIVAQGHKENLIEFIETIRKGPLFSKITDLDVVWHDKPQDVFTEFEIW